MTLSARTKRVQRARKAGKTVKEIAAKEGISIQTVYRLTAGKKFRQELLGAQVHAAITKATISQDMVQLAQKFIDIVKALPENKLQRFFKGPDGLQKWVNALESLNEQAVQVLHPLLKQAEEEKDPELERAKAMLPEVNP